MSYQYFRPYLTLEELEAIAALLDKENRASIENNTRIDQSLYSAWKKIMKLKVTATVGITQPVYEGTGLGKKGAKRESFKESLMLEEGSISPEEKRKNEIMAKRFKAFQKWEKTPEFCNEDELELARTYRYENNLMDKEEVDKMFADMFVFPGIPG